MAVLPCSVSHVSHMFSGPLKTDILGSKKYLLIVSGWNPLFVKFPQENDTNDNPLEEHGPIATYTT